MLDRIGIYLLLPHGYVCCKPAPSLVLLIHFFLPSHPQTIGGFMGFKLDVLA